MNDNKDALRRITSILKGTQFSRTEDFLSCIEHAVSYIEKCEQETVAANKQLEEYSKDEEIRKLQEKNHEMYQKLLRGFSITEEEAKAIRKWQETHKDSGGAIGGGYTYEFTPTAIGTIGTIKRSNGESFTFRELT